MAQRSAQRKAPALPVWDTPQHGDRAHDQQSANVLRRAHQPNVRAAAVLALYNSKDQLQVTDSKWAEWQAKAAEHAAQRKASPAGGDFAAMLQAALQKAQSSSKGRTRRGVQGAEQQAKEAAQRREKDPAAKRVRLVKDMGYLSLKRAALLGLLQQQQMGEQQQQQEGSSRNSKRSSLQLKFASSTLQR